MTRVALAVLAALACGRGGSRSTGRNTTMEDMAHVWFTQDLQYGSLSVSFCRSGPTLALVTGNLGDGQEIGHYDAKLGSGPYDRLRDLKRRAGFDQVAPSGAVQPGTPGVSIGETLDGDTYDMKGWTLWEIPPAIQPLIDEARRLTQEVVKHPVRVLRGRGAAQGSVRANEPAAFDVSLESVGTEPVLAANPLSTADPEFAGLRVAIRPEANANGEGNLWIDVAPQDVSGAPGAARAAHVQVPPGQKLTFTIRRKLLASPGRYRAFVLYYATPPRDDPKALRGTLRIDLGTFEIVSAKGR